MARVAVFEYDTLPPDLQRLADAYQARGASWDHLRVMAHRAGDVPSLLQVSLSLAH